MSRLIFEYIIIFTNILFIIRIETELNLVEPSRILGQLDSIFMGRIDLEHLM